MRNKSRPVGGGDSTPRKKLSTTKTDMSTIIRNKSHTVGSLRLEIYDCDGHENRRRLNKMPSFKTMKYICRNMIS